MSRRSYKKLEQSYIDWLKSLGCVFYGLTDSTLTNIIDGSSGIVDTGASAVYDDGVWLISSSVQYKGGVVFEGEFLTKYNGLTLNDETIEMTIVADCAAINETGDYYAWLLAGTNSSDYSYFDYIGKFDFSNARSLVRRSFVRTGKTRKYYNGGELVTRDTDTRNWLINDTLTKKIIIGGGSFRTGTIMVKNVYVFNKALTQQQVQQLT